MNTKRKWHTKQEREIDQFLSTFDGGKGVKMTKTEIMRAMLVWGQMKHDEAVRDFVWTRGGTVNVRELHQEAIIARCEEAKGKLHYGKSYPIP